MPGTQPTRAVSSPVANLADSLVSSEIAVYSDRGSPPADVLSPPPAAEQAASAGELTIPSGVMLKQFLAWPTGSQQVPRRAEAPLPTEVICALTLFISILLSHSPP